ncbi:hypothetical protein B5D80_14305 [Micromonospora wenchangensis]|uniref:Uncharacterized protein n=1 Tax=Micromonospora wenchangensis TaxID=1185415 RepID=A0A246RM68_9ACTN|nr:hypothetical protein [Micromonospora wenchangensis]OWV07543.1 hypothetical protein B5D80_14305 [Micromonospora wenchangensis]
MTDPPDPVHAALVGAVLVVHTATEPSAALAGVAARLPADPDRTVVLCSATVSARPDLFGLLADLLPRQLGGSAAGFRLVPLGGYADPVAVPDSAAGLCTDLGIDGAVPLDAPAVSTRGVPSARRWIAADGGPARPEQPPAAWCPPPAGPSRPVGGPEGWLVAPVGDGYTWLPATWPPPAAGPRHPEPAEPAPPAVPALSAEPALPGRSVGPVLSVADTGRPERTDAGGPGAPGGPPAGDRGRPPGRPVPGGWSFLPDPAATPPGTPLGRDDLPGPGLRAPVPLDVFLVEVALGAGGFQVDGRPVPPGVLAGHLAALRHDGRPVVLCGDAPYPATAGMLFGALADALGAPVVAGDARVEVTATGLLTSTGTFRRWRPRPAAGTARTVTDLGPVLPAPACLPTAPPTPPDEPATTGAEPVVTGVEPATTGTAPATTRAEPVVTAAREAVPPDGAGAAPDAPGVLLSGVAASAVDPAAVPADGADRWQRIAAPRLDLLRVASPEVTGDGPPPAPEPTDTPPPAPEGPTPGPTAPPATAHDEPAPAPGRPDTPVRPPDATPDRPEPVPGPVADGPGAPPAAVPEPRPAPPAPTRVPVTFRLDGSAPTAGDRTALRRILAGRYDSYTQVVTRTLAEEPGLRVAAVSAPDLPAGLVAVRAYCTGERETVNPVLRGDAAPADDPAVLARWVGYGLRRLPVVFGPVFRAAAVAPPGGYPPGTLLVEPAFLDVDPTPAPVPDAGVRFVIWSVGARRLGGLGTTGTGARTTPTGIHTGPRTDGTAVFPAGTCFQVLADEPVGDRELRQVFLRELPAGRPTQGGEQTLERLRAAVGAGDPAGGGTPPLPVGVGVDGAGRLFAPPSG